MTENEPIPFNRLTEDTDLLPFDCGIRDLNEFLFNDAKQYQKKLLAVTYYIESEGKILLFFTLSNDKISITDEKNGNPLFSKSFFRKIKDKFGRTKHRTEYPAVKIGRFGVHRDYRESKQHWGSRTLDFLKDWMITANKTGCCFITVDAYASAVGFYLKNGFKFLGTHEEKAYKDWESSNREYRHRANFNEDMPTFAMYFNLLSLLTDN